MKMLPFGMQRLFLRSRRKALLLVTLGSFLIVGSVLFAGNVKNPYAIELGNDYDLNEDASAIDGVHAMVRHMGIVKRKVAAAANRVNNKPNIWSTDRKPQAAPDEEMYDYNSATNNVPADAMKYTFLNQKIKMADVNELVNETSKLDSDMYADEKDEIEDTDPDDDTDQEYEDYPENPVFKPGDFDEVSNSTRIPFRFQEVSSKDKDVEYDMNLYPKPDHVPAAREQSNHLRNSRVLHSQSWSEKTGREEKPCLHCNSSVVTRINTQKTKKKKVPTATLR